MKIFLSILFFSLFCGAAVVAQTVSNVSVSQEGKMIVVSYDIDKASSVVQLTVSTDGGNTFSSPLKKVSGDITNVKPGHCKIVWDVLSEMESFCGEKVVFNIIVDVSASITKGNYVDLGLSVKWATKNLGASKPYEFGGYYQWAGLEDVSTIPNFDRYEHYPYCTGNSSVNPYWTKYNNDSSYGNVDNRNTLESKDDVAHIKLGGKWRIPTVAEWNELREECIWSMSTLKGVNGFLITSKKPGYTDKSIFLPFAGVGDLQDDWGYYWSSSVDKREDPGESMALIMNLESFFSGCLDVDRRTPLSIRPVF